MAYSLIDDLPAEPSNDKLAFTDYVQAIERQVLTREDKAAFVVGIYGAWGSGKSSLLNMLHEHLKNQHNSFEVVEFSPWLYRNETSLLLPLLAELAKKYSAFEKLIKGIVNVSPDIMAKVTSLGLDATLTGGLPLFTLLSEFGVKDKPVGLLSDGLKQRKAQQNTRGLKEKITEAVNIVTKNGKKKLVFLIDDLDRCHEAKQIINLLEQIKLLLNIDHCLFFICTDKKQIINAIDEIYKGQGAVYLDKFIQLGFDLPPHHSHSLSALLPLATEDKALRAYLKRVAEVLDYNPRQLKKLWNRAVMALEFVQAELLRWQQPSDARLVASIELMLKWLLIQEAGLVNADSYHYLGFEELTTRLNFSEAETYFNIGSGTIVPLQQRVLLFLCYEKNHRFKTPRQLSLYVKASGISIQHSRLYIENTAFNGTTDFENQDFSNWNLTGGIFSDLIFNGCDLSLCDFSHAQLHNVRFENCNLHGVCFNEAELTGVHWGNCQNTRSLIQSTRIGELVIIAEQLKQQSLDDTYNFSTDEQESLLAIYRYLIIKLPARADDLREQAMALRIRIYP
ncbi:MAG: P-loop NTPase fold protein [Methylotenera sp.]